MITENLNPIYLKLATRICDNILSEKYKEEERIPSVRDFAAKMEVNPNTVMRAFDWLQQKEIIYNKRGMGYFVSPRAKSVIASIRKEQFKNSILPSVFKTMLLLDIKIEEIIKDFEQYKAKEK